MPIVEHDVSVDYGAAQEMVRRSGQQGVPVITAGDEVIVGFDQRRLGQIAERYAKAGQANPATPKLGLSVRDAPGGGVEVGGTRPGSLAQRAGLQPGDFLESLAGQPVRSVADLEKLGARLRSGQRVPLGVRRAGQLLELDLTT